MHFHLVVTNPFGIHAAGDIVSDPDMVDQLLQTHADRVVKTVPPQPTAARED